MKGFLARLRKDRYRLLALLRLFVVAGFAIILIVFDSIFKSRSFAIFLVVLIITIWIGARMVEDYYGFKSRRLALRYLLALLFGAGYPTYEIKDGIKKNPKGDMNWLDLVGGPCILKIEADHAVLVESLHSAPLVYREGTYLLKPFDILRAILYLKDCKEKIEEVVAITKDGIRVAVRDIQFGYGIATDQEIRQRIGSEHPVLRYSEDLALKAFVYYRPVSESDGPQVETRESFAAAVAGKIRFVVQNYINSNQVDPIIAPRYHEKEPRQEIETSLLPSEKQRRFAEIGAKLLWVDIGYFDIPDENVEKQRLQTWKSGWVGKAKVIRAYGEAHQLANQELGRAEAQAEMLNGILHALREIGLSDDKAEREKNLKKVILVKTAQMLESMTSSYQEPDEPNKRENKRNNPG